MLTCKQVNMLTGLDSILVDNPALLRVQNLVFYYFEPALLFKCTIVFEFIFQQASEQKQATTFFKTCHLLYIDAVNSVGNFLLLFSDWQTFFFEQHHIQSCLWS